MFNSSDYLEKVYAGVLGKIIGVYLGRPFEGWSYERIKHELGEIQSYVNEKLGMPLVLTDDDIAGTFTFPKAILDYKVGKEITAAQIGQTWLNYIVENKSILWWGGFGNSTEHTAFIRLKNGIAAPMSGSMPLNGKIIAEQIGAQIFIDGWALVSPGDPDLAVELAGKAASVSHDGEAVYAAQVLAVMESLAFIETDLNKILDISTNYIPGGSVIYQLISDLREWHAASMDWEKAREKIKMKYGYDHYKGNCHVVPNHALIHLGLLFGENDFQKSLMITNTSGWDTDCNSGNVGCFLGIKNGLEGLNKQGDWRGPVADRLYLPTADGGGCITDAVRETITLGKINAQLYNHEWIEIKGGARFNFEFPGSMQGFTLEPNNQTHVSASINNILGKSKSGTRCLELAYNFMESGNPIRISTPVFIPHDALNMIGYSLHACPTLYPGQNVKVGISADEHNPCPVVVRIFASMYGKEDALENLPGKNQLLLPGEYKDMDWKIPETNGYPLEKIGIELNAETASAGKIYLDYITWDSQPDLTLTRPKNNSNWRRAWIQAVDAFESCYQESFRIIQNHGRGLLIQGTREWKDYIVEADILPHLYHAFGIAARVQGLQRYYALIYSDHSLQIIKFWDAERVLAKYPFDWALEETHVLSMKVCGKQISAAIDGNPLFSIEDNIHSVESGGIAYLCEEGCISSNSISVKPA